MGTWLSSKMSTAWGLVLMLCLGLLVPLPLRAQVVKLVPDDVLPGDRFGWAVVLDDTDLVIGAAFDDVDALDAGSAYAFERRPNAPNTWLLRSQLIDDDPQPIDEFGFAVDVVGDVLAIGVEDDDDTRGGVMLFERQGDGAWQAERKIRLADAEIEDSLGVALDMEGDFLVVGSVRGILRDDPPGGVNRPGIAHLFHRHQDGLEQWGHVTPLEASDGLPGNAFGHTVTLAGDWLAVGAPGTPERGDEGTVYLYRRHAGGQDGWGEVQRLQAVDVGAGDTFGWAVELSPDGTSLYVGAPRHDGDADNGGAVYRFQRSASGLFEQTQKLTAPTAEAQSLFGFSISLDGDRLGVGSIFGDDSGTVDLFELDDLWRPVARVHPPDGGIGDQFGFALDLDGGSLVVGAPYHRSVGDEGGAAYVYRLQDLITERCVPDDLFVHCLNGGRFQVSIEWSDFSGADGRGMTVPFKTDDSGLFWFFRPGNWEMQVKVLDGCDFNQHYWVFAAATTDVAYTLTVRDTEQDVEVRYTNPLGTSAAAVTDTSALATCP